MYLAHISEDGSREQKLLDHLKGTADFAGRFAEVFGCASWGYACGMMHDIGKYSEEFQRRLHGGPKVDHSTAGAVELYHRNAFLASYCIAGHHAGLPDGGTQADVSGEPTLWGRIKKEKNLPSYDQFHLEVEYPVFQMPGIKPLGNGGFSMAFFIRMVYSCLVDADYLDTEAFMSDGEVKRRQYDSMEVLFERFQKYIGGWLENTDLTTINGRRSEILRNCMAEAYSKPGLYSLTVPTGGGKTISSLAFALQHAVLHKKDRVIYVIPYTSIIEQNAGVFRKILGDDQILENHCNVSYENAEELERKQLAAENWDMPVIVTTNVQFFESFFANKSGKCRKLHHIANSVIIFDEAQMLPNQYLKPCVQTISELVVNYRCTAVLCTATQPSLPKLFPPEISCREICRHVEEQFQFFRRNTIQNLGGLTEAELADRLKKEPQVLCILNNRKRVQKIYQELGREGVYHLSTLMYPEHRKKVLRDIRACLQQDRPCRVIATSLVEAGVDLDFPMVYRELAGIDSVIQAAGRCNREGKRLFEESKTYVFTMEETDLRVPLMLKQPIAVTKQILRESNDIASLESIQEYFDRLHYVKGEELDKKHIVEKFENDRSIRSASFPFATVAKEFRLIENDTKTIVIEKEPEARELVNRLRYGEHSRELIRIIGKYCVSVYRNDYEKLEAAGLIEKLDGEFSLLRNQEQYSEDIGLNMNVERGDAVIF